MKKIIFLLSMVCSASAFAQRVSVDKDVITVDDIPYGKIVNTGSTFAPAFSIQNTDGDELALVDMSNDDQMINTGSTIVTKSTSTKWLISFNDYPNLKGYLHPSIPLKKTIAKEIVRYKLIKDGKIDKNAVNRFCNTHDNAGTDLEVISANNYANGTSQSVAVVKSYDRVERNTSETIYSANGTIKQDFKTIGKYKSEMGMVNNMPGKIITFYGMDNSKIATVKYENFKEEATVLFPRNNEKTTISISNANELKVLDEIIKYLVDNNYM